MLRQRLLVYAFVVSLATFGFLLPNLDHGSPVRENGEEILHWDWLTGSEARWIQQEMALFARTHPELRVKRTGIADWQRYRELLGAALDARDAVDVFYVPRRMTLTELVERGWVQPLHGIDSQAWRARYADVDLAASSVAGRLYSFPVEAPAARVRVLLCNRRVFEAANLVQSGEPLPPLHTWEDVVAVAHRITEVLAPDASGFGFGGRAPSRAMSYWLDVAQAAGGFNYLGGLDGLDPRTGTFEYATNPAYRGAILTLLALRDQGSLFPGTMTWTHDDALRNFLDGRFAMTFGTLNDLRVLADVSADRSRHVEVLPLPRPRTHPCSWYHTGAGRTYHLAPRASTPAAEWLAWLSTEAAASRWRDAGLGPTVFAAAAPPAARIGGPAYEQFLEIAPREVCLAPDPARRHPDFARLRIRPALPDAVDVVEGVFLGRLDLDTALVDLDVRHEEALGRAIATLRANGSTFDRSDLVFSDWQPIPEARR